MLINKIYRLVDTAIEAFEEMANCYRVAAYANAQCAEAQAQNLKVGKANEENLKIVSEINETTRKTEETRGKREALLFAHDDAVLGGEGA